MPFERPFLDDEGSGSSDPKLPAGGVLFMHIQGILSWRSDCHEFLRLDVIDPTDGASFVRRLGRRVSGFSIASGERIPLTYEVDEQTIEMQVGGATAILNRNFMTFSSILISNERFEHKPWHARSAIFGPDGLPVAIWWSPWLPKDLDQKITCFLWLDTSHPYWRIIGTFIVLRFFRASDRRSHN